MMERRDFIQACGALLGSSLLLAGCGQGGDGADEVTFSSEDLSLPDLSRGQWARLPDLNFSVAHDTYGAIDTTLTAVDDGAYDPVTDQFSIVLTGPELPVLEEGVYQVYNSSLGYFDLFLQPGESPAGERRYRSHFSLLHG